MGKHLKTPHFSCKVAAAKAGIQEATTISMMPHDRLLEKLLLGQAKGKCLQYSSRSGLKCGSTASSSNMGAYQKSSSLWPALLEHLESSRWGWAAELQHLSLHSLLQQPRQQNWLGVPQITSPHLSFPHLDHASPRKLQTNLAVWVHNNTLYIIIYNKSAGSAGLAASANSACAGAASETWRRCLAHRHILVMIKSMK